MEWSFAHCSTLGYVTHTTTMLRIGCAISLPRLLPVDVTGAPWFLWPPVAKANAQVAPGLQGVAVQRHRAHATGHFLQPNMLHALHAQ